MPDVRRDDLGVELRVKLHAPGGLAHDERLVGVTTPWASRRAFAGRRSVDCVWQTCTGSRGQAAEQGIIRGLRRQIDRDRAELPAVRVVADLPATAWANNWCP